MSGRSRSTPRCSSRGNARPASTTMISSPSSYTVMFLPTSSRPPSGMIRSESLTRLSLRARLEREDVHGEQCAVHALCMDGDGLVLLRESIESGQSEIRLLVADRERPYAVDDGELDLLGPDTGELDDLHRLGDRVPRVAFTPRSRGPIRRRKHLLDRVRQRSERAVREGPADY